MSRLRTMSVLTAASLTLSAAPAALAGTSTVGDSSTSATANVCLLSFDCTYVNFRHGKPTDVVLHSGTLTSWSLAAGSVNGTVQLRILRPAGHGKLKFVHSSSTETVLNSGENTFAAHVRVRAGDVLALSNASSGIYMAAAPSGSCVRYFDSPVTDGWTGRPNRVAPELHLLVSASVKR